MKIEGYTFAAGAAFWFPAAAIYWVLSREEVGTTGLVFSGFLATIIAAYLISTSRRMEPRPEDRSDAEITEGAGDVGFFSPGSWWPIAIAGAASVMGVGLAYMAVWLMLIGFGLLLITVTGLLFEYYVGLGREDGQQVAREH